MVDMNIVTGETSPIDDAGEDDIYLPDEQAVLHMVDFDNVKTLEDVILLFKTSQIGVYSNNPHFKEVAYLLTNKGGLGNA